MQGIPQVALVGYTNAGKSTLLNAFIDKYEENEEKKEDRKVMAKNMLFATLDTTVRKIHLPDKREFLLSDTVGFISKLPHNLVEAFHSTLEEVKFANLLLEVVDYSDEHYMDHMEVTRQTLINAILQRQMGEKMFQQSFRISEKTASIWQPDRILV